VQNGINNAFITIIYAKKQPKNLSNKDGSQEIVTMTSHSIPNQQKIFTHQISLKSGTHVETKL